MTNSGFPGAWRLMFVLLIIPLSAWPLMPAAVAQPGMPTARPAAPETSHPAVAPERVAARQTLLASVTIFVLAIFLGVELISKVPATLHTPLMSGSNAISGITVVGAIITAGASAGLAPFIGFLAVILAMINVVGGFLVTHRMLKMFKRKG